MRLPASSRPQIGHHFALELALGLGRGGQLMAAQGELVLLFARDALRLGQELGGDAHRQRALGRAMEQLGIQVDAGVHRNVLHVLQPADDLHVFEAGHDGVRGLVDGLQARAAEAVDRGAAGVRGQAGHQARRRGRR